MATELSAITLPNIIVPQVVPGGQFVTPEEEDFRQQLQDILNEYGDVLNILIDNSNETITTIGAGGIGTFNILATSVQGISAGAITGGNHAIQELSDGQLVCCWREYTGSGNDFLFRLLKAESPYTHWTSLDGTGTDPTNFAVTSSGGGNAPCFCEDTEHGNLYLFWFDSGTSDWYCSCFPSAGDGTFGAATTAVSVDTLSTDDHSAAPCAISKEGYLFFASMENNGTTFDMNIYRGDPTATSSTWSKITNFRGVYDGSTRATFTTINDQVRIVDNGGDGLMLLWEWSDSSTRGNVAFTTSDDNGATWEYNDISGGGTYLDYNAIDNGNILGLSASGTNVGSDLYTAGFGAQNPICRWDAAYIEETTGEVALTYLNGRTSTTNAGIRYAHWTPAAGWSATATRPLLSGTRAARPNGVVTSGGIVRAFWFYWRSMTSVAAGAMATRKCTEGEDTEDLENWGLAKTLINLPMDTATATQATLIEGFCVSPQGTVEIDSAEYIPAMFVRQTADASAQSEICFTLFSVTGIDRP